jgi:protein-tyrosine phosphatase
MNDESIMYDGIIDVHCHILPGIDDGAKDMDTSLSMADIAQKEGISTLIATPHFWYGHYENSYEEVSKRVEELNVILKSKHINVNILTGQEVFFDRHTLEHYRSGVIKGLNSTRYILLELPMDRIPENVFESIYELQLLGAEIIIAHPERYMYIINKPSIINSFIEEGCLFQINAGSITGKLGGSIKRTAQVLMQHNICDFLASDAHSTGSRRPVLSEAYGLINESLKAKLTYNCNKLLENTEIEKCEEKIKDRSFFSFFYKNNFLKKK